MNQLLGMLEITLDSETIFGGDTVQRETVDIDLQSDEYGLPFLAGRTVKGLLRREAQWYVNHLPTGHREEFEAALVTLFGEADRGGKHRSNHRGLKFGTAKLSDAVYDFIKRKDLPTREVFHAVTLVRSMTSIDEETGTAKDGSLRQARVMQRDYTLFSPIFSNRELSANEKKLLETSVKLLRHLGMMRSRGKGEVTCRLEWNKDFVHLQGGKRQEKSRPTSPYYILLQIENQEALKINDILRTSDSTSALNYIPGYVLRGALVHTYMNECGIEEAELNTETIFNEEDIQFWNGYLRIGNHRSIPFPANLYEPKEQARRGVKSGEARAIYNDLTDDIKEIEEQAPVRVDEEMMVLDKEKLIASSVEKTSLLHLSLNGPKDNDKEGKLYRYESIAPGQEFMAVIKVDRSNDFTDWLLGKDDFYLWLGGARNSGYGRSRVKVSISHEHPEQFVNHAVSSNELYIIATSHWILRNNQGQISHVLDEEFLSEKLGARIHLDKYILNSALTGGYVSHWQAYHPIVRSVKAGSIFRYRVEGDIDLEGVKKLLDEGVGERRNEGFGRLMILTSWPYKQLVESNQAKLIRENVMRKHRSTQKEKAEIQRLKTGFIKQDIENVMHEKVRQWYQSMLDSFRFYISKHGQGKIDVSRSQIGDLYDFTKKMQRDSKKHKDVKSFYKNSWNRFWSDYDRKNSNKERKNLDLIRVEQVHLRDFIKEDIPRHQWRSNYFHECLNEEENMKVSLEALELLFRKMLRDYDMERFYKE